MMNSKTTALACALLSASVSWAAVPPVDYSASPKRRSRPVDSRETSHAENVIMALRLPKSNRIQALKSSGRSSVDGLLKLAQDEHQSLSLRWRAIMAVAEIDPVRAQPMLERAVQSKDWYLRNAAVLAMVHGPRDRAVYWAKRLLDDSALVVRTAAVQTLEKLRAIEAEDKLWEKLKAEDSFKNGQSLWVRKYIARTLSHFARPGQESKFKDLLRDRDASLHPYALLALRRMTGQLSATETRSIEEQRRYWLSR